MKVFIYSDLHISKTSSILPLVSDNSKYTYRQNMIIKLGKYLANIIDKERPDLIINLGDTFDQHTVSSYDIDVASEFFKCFRYLSIPHLVLVGNHEMINYDFNAIKILSNIDNITVISKPSSVDCRLLPNIDSYDVTATKISTFPKIAVMPYMEHSDILKLPEGEFLFSHIDIAGVKVRDDYELETGVDIKSLSDYKLVFNGHIHKSSIKGNVVNVGSISTHSFSDDEHSVPQCYLFDTDTLDLKTFKPTICPLFRKCNINTISDLDNYIATLDKSYKYVLNVTCPFNIKEDVKNKLSQGDMIISSRLNVKADNKSDNKIDIQANVKANIDIKQTFKEFLDTVDLKYPKELYYTVLEGVK